MNPQALRELFLAPAHSWESIAYKTEHSVTKRNRITFQPAILSPPLGTRAKRRRKPGNGQARLH